MSVQHTITRLWHRNLKRAGVLTRMVLTPFAYAYITIEYSFFLLLHARAIIRASYVYSLWFWSFGHQATDLHMLTLRFPQKNLLVLISDYKNFHRPITDSFRDHCTIVYFRHTWLMYMCWKNVLGIWPTVRWKQRLITGLIRMARSPAILVRDYHARRGPAVAGLYLTEYMELMAGHPHLNITASPTAIERAKTIIAKRDPALLTQPVVAVYLRKKRAGVYDVRDTDPLPYAPALRMLRERGVLIFCGGDYAPDDITPDTDGLFGYADFPGERALIDFYFLTQSKFMIGAHSGPLPICTAFNVPVLITNNAFYYLTGYKPDHRLLNKKLVEKRSGRQLTAREIFSHPVVAYNQTVHFDRAGLMHIDNTADELTAAITEMTELILNGKDIATEADQKRIEQYLAFLPPDSMAHQSPARPVASYLRGLHFE